MTASFHKEGWGHKNSSTLPLFIGVHVPIQESERSCICVLWVSSQENERSCICVLGVSILPLFVILLLDFGTVSFYS
jgi:hypothetical protein